MSQSRQLAAIMFTDIVGYTALMGQDSNKAMELVRQAMTFQKSLVQKHNGIWIKEMGDGAMARFNTALDAVNCALDIQRAARADFQGVLRIGIHLGDITIENDDVFGDGVNVASRLQSIADPGGIYISESIEKAIRGQGATETVDLGEMELKNVNYGVRTYALKGTGLPAAAKKPSWEKLKKYRVWLIVAGVIWVIGWTLYPKLSGSNEHNGGPTNTTLESGIKSIAVLAFVDMSQAKDQEYFSDGLSENVIDLLAKVPGLKVIGRTSSFSFKGRNEDLRVIGEKLGVANILEGSVQKDGNKLRITAQLIRSADGFHLWSGKYDRELKDVFDIQDEISLAILKAIKVELVGDEKEVVLKKYTDNVEAYQLYLQGRFYYNKYNPDAFMKAIEYFKAAIAIDPNYAIAYSGMAFCYMNLWSMNWSPPDKCLPQAIQAANKALELDDAIEESHLNVGRIKLHFEYKIREAEIEFKKAIAINPNSAEVHVQLGFCAALLGNNKEAIEHALKAQSLDPFSLLNLAYIGTIYWIVADPEKTLAIGKRLVDMEPNFPPGHSWVGAHNILLKKYEAAISEFEMAVKLYPDISNLGNLGCTYGVMGDKIKAREIIEKMKKIEGADIVGNTQIGRVYGSLGEWDTAFQYFDKAIENHESRILWIMSDFSFMQIDMKDPRVMRLLEKMGQPFK